ncbi:MAG TPA: hypothetical protein VII66_04765, partial [Gemmatimonadaceae bacterium]
RSHSRIGGRFPDGDYMMRASSAHLDTLDIGISERAIHVSPATRQSLLTVVPATDMAVATLCPHDTGGRDMLLHGTVHDSRNGEPVRGARVTVS